MFKNSIKAILISIAVATGGFAATATTASAGNLNIDFSISGPGYSFSTGSGYRRTHYRESRKYRNYRGYPRRGYRDLRHRRNAYRDRPVYQDRYRVRRCSPRHAVKKARRMGVRDARIVRVNRRAIVVKGYRYGEWTKVKFGRGGRCPVIVVRSL